MYISFFLLENKGIVLGVENFLYIFNKI